MKFNYFLLAVLFHLNIACNQSKNERTDVVSHQKDTLLHTDTLRKPTHITYSPIDFSSIEGNDMSLTGSYHFRYSIELTKHNTFGIGFVYMFYKNGDEGWKLENMKRFAKDTLLGGSAIDIANERLIHQDKNRLKDFNSFAFFIDKKYLTESVADHNTIYHYPTPNTNIEVILYQKLVGEKKWVEIDRRAFKTDEYGGYNKTWMINFVKDKRQQFK
ncbi:hypothetical protein VB264_22030 [Arcicella aquatica]|uniref:Uncharacterized protein n=1 Tax=Arcicella aquatica TaxID=217141 RepID=A0ABU5QTR5_9BACT|nr:hypothetical protein [Arcicella aquatica]MEA5260492.1 hypothetical protein [Arcicella aquatica]